MLIPEDELRYLPHFQVDENIQTCTTYLWQHCHTEHSLLDYAHIHYPLMAWEKFSMLKGKRLKERLSVEMLAKQLLGQKAEIRHEPNGKPFVSLKNIEISVSHSFNIYAISLSRQRHGMDIEQWGKKALRVREKFLSQEEEPLLSAFVTLTREQAATLLWSAKEAVFKAYDYPGLDFKDDINLWIKGKSLQAQLTKYGKKAEIEYTIYPTCIHTLCRTNCSEKP